jgi:hypothetical protein
MFAVHDIHRRAAGNPATLGAEMRIQTAKDAGMALRERRQQLGLTQQHVAELADVGRPWLCANAERFQHPESPAHPFSDPSLGVHRQRCSPKGRNEPGSQVAVLADLDVRMEVASTVG